jgi:hypothetical protein
MQRSLMLALAGLLLIASKGPAEAKSRYCALTVQVEPAGATIHLGRRSWPAPKRLWLRCGVRYTLRIKKPGLPEKVINVRQTRRYDTRRVTLAKLEGTVVITAGNKATHGAVVYIDGQPLRPLPTTIKRPPGRLAIEVRKPGYAKFRRWISVVSGKSTALEVKLAAKSGQLMVTSTPSGALVKIDGKPAGKTPLLAESLATGKHVVEIKSGKRPAVTRLVEIQASTTARLQLQLGPAAKQKPSGGTLQVLAEPDNVDVYVNGVFSGKAPLKLRGVDLGTHHVAIKWPGHETAEKKVKIEAGKVTTFKVRLKKLATATARRALPTAPGTGNLIVISSVRGASVFLDGAEVGRTPYARANLPAGSHGVRVAASGYQAFDQQILVKSGATKRITAILQPQATYAAGSGAGGAGASGGSLSKRSDDDDDAPSDALSAYGAHLVPPRAFTAALSLGFPYLVDARLTTGVFARRHLALDISVALRSYGTVTEGAIGSRVRLLHYEPFSLAAIGEIGAGGGPGERNTFFFKAGVSGTLRFKDMVTVTASVYGDFYSDRICPASDAGDDEPEACTFPPEELSFDEVRGRFFGVRLFLAATVEVALSSWVNLFGQIEGTPFQSERLSFTDAFASYMLETDPRFYGRLGVAFKF